jgi:HK97 family phage portal protein
MMSRLWEGRHPSDSSLSRMLGAGLPSIAGVEVNEKTAMQVAAYYACVRDLSEDVAKLPLQLYRLGISRERASNHPVDYLLHTRANPESPAITFREAMTAHALTLGNGYAEIVRNGAGRAVQMYLLEPWRVRPDRINGELVYRVDGEPKASADIFHLRGLGPDGVVGYSVLEAARESLGLAIAQQQYSSAFYGNNAAPSAAIELPPEMSSADEDTLSVIRRGWENKYKGAHKGSTVGLLLPGMKVHTYQISPKDAEFLTSRQFSVEEVCRWFRMPPHKVQHLLRSTFNNIEHMSIEYVVDTLLPWLIRWEQEASYKLLTVREQSLYYVEHNIEGQLRGDSASRAEFYRKMFEVGGISQNEIRRRENLPDVGPEGDVFYVPVNLIPVGRALSMSPKADQQPSQEPTPTDPAAETPVDRQATLGENPSPQAAPPSSGPSLESMRVGLASVLDRFLAKAANESIRKANAGPQRFCDWLDSLQAQWSPKIEEGIYPSCRIYWESCSISAGDLGAFVVAVAKNHLSATHQQLNDIADSATPRNLVSRVTQLVRSDQWKSRGMAEAMAQFEGDTHAPSTE